MSESTTNSWQSSYTSKDPGLYFQDGKRRIDFVLVFNESGDKPGYNDKRDRFLNGLIKSQIEIEIENCFDEIIGSTDEQNTEQQEEAKLEDILPRIPTGGDDDEAVGDDDEFQPNPSGGRPSAIDRYQLGVGGSKRYLGPSDLIFVKLYAPWKVMTHYAEMFKIRKPLKDVKRTPLSRSKASSCSDCSTCTDSHIKPLHSPATYPFNQERPYLFDIPDNRDEFFTPYERALVLDYILRRTRCLTDEEMAEDYDEPESPPAISDIGIMKMISDGIFTAAYPLHEFSRSEQLLCQEANAQLSGQSIADEPGKIEVNNRVLLNQNWASYKCIFRRQPLDYIRFYFGEAIAFYFAWLGYYTMALLPMAILGLLVFLLSFIRMDDDPISLDVCNHGQNTLMCPACRVARCKFWTLNNSCMRTQLTQLVDNEGTVLFGVAMALWAIIFLELWKRKQIELAYEWNVYTIEQLDQPARPEFLALLFQGYREYKNPISGDMEPKIPFWRRRVPFFVFSYTTLLFAVVLTLATLVGIIVYKLVIKIVLFESPNPFIQRTGSMIATLTGSVINLVIIFIMKFIYDRIAVKMNDLEYHRSQIDYDNSLTLKLYMLQFVNYYASVFYIAFIQGPSAALPGSKHSMAQSTGCDEGNCLFELFLQLTIIMVGKQLLSFLQETFLPLIFRLLHKIRQSMRLRRAYQQDAGNLAGDLEGVDTDVRKSTSGSVIGCRTDFTLLDPGSRPLFEEYLEMMIQFGFITMFVPAFPLAPLFGFLNNIFEIRLDAKKFIGQYRRPVLERVKSIGIWLSILLVLSSLAIRTNACVIAFTTNFIDRWVYRVYYSNDFTDTGFKKFTLSVMETSRFMSNTTEPYCYYQDYREPPWVNKEMKHTLIYYQVLAAKFIFVFIFELVATFLTSLIAAMIPDVPEGIERQIMCEQKETSKLIAQSKAGPSQPAKPTSFFKTAASRLPQVLWLSAQTTQRTPLLCSQSPPDDNDCS